MAPDTGTSHIHGKHEQKAPESTPVYTCPRHPEIQQQAPGACPKCGMALEPLMPVAKPSAARFTCPMHPEIKQQGPGPCPKCGMALEPVMPIGKRVAAGYA